ncbi:hypothetical protein JD508_18755 [Aeromonas jandaei]|uniref:hypothetical protein n=1 Tax=Aeromonas jandaei TaxID=650 RepID=UPI00191DA3E6|nr:hypothetical protein [Aeromonas jandaei]MBL0612270.1 hypothetical protein [Aeromonas jandaei]
MLDKLMTYIESENYIYALIAIVISLGYNSLKFLDAYHIQRKRRIADLENTIKSKYISTAFKKKLREDIECEYFRLSYGVRTQKELIDQVFDLHSKTKIRLPFSHFARAMKLTPTVVTMGNITNLKASALDYAFGLYHAFFGIIFLLIGLSTFFYQLYLDPSIPDGRILLQPALTIAGGIYLMYMGVPVYSLFKINRELKNSTL